MYSNYAAKFGRLSSGEETNQAYPGMMDYFATVVSDWFPIGLTVDEPMLNTNMFATTVRSLHYVVCHAA